MAWHSPELMTRDTANSRISGYLKVLFMFSGYIVPYVPDFWPKKMPHRSLHAHGRQSRASCRQGTRGISSANAGSRSNDFIFSRQRPFSGPTSSRIGPSLRQSLGISPSSFFLRKSCLEKIDLVAQLGGVTPLLRFVINNLTVRILAVKRRLQYFSNMVKFRVVQTEIIQIVRRYFLGGRP